MLHSLAVKHIETYRICSIFMNHFHGIGIVFKPLRHFAAVCRQDNPVDDNILERRCLEQRCRQDRESVEPPSGLVYAFGNEICRKICFKKLLILEGIVILCIRHGARFKPAVKNFRNAIKQLSISFDLEMVNFMPV